MSSDTGSPPTEEQDIDFYELREKPRLDAKRKLMEKAPPHTCGGTIDKLAKAFGVPARPENSTNLVECVACEMTECPGAHPEHGDEYGCPLCDCEPDVDHPWTPLELALKAEVEGLSIALQDMEDRLLWFEMRENFLVSLVSEDRWQSWRLVDPPLPSEEH